MERGKYERTSKAGISAVQKEILAYLFACNANPPGYEKTIVDIRNALRLPDNWSTKTSLGRSLSRLRTRGLIRSAGRNSNNQHIWKIGNGI